MEQISKLFSGPFWEVFIPSILLASVGGTVLIVLYYTIAQINSKKGVSYLRNLSQIILTLFWIQFLACIIFFLPTSFTEGVSLKESMNWVGRHFKSIPPYDQFLDIARSYQVYISAIYCVGFSLFIGKFILQYFYLHKIELQLKPLDSEKWLSNLEKLSQKLQIQTPEIRILENIQTPFTFGFWKPVLVIPMCFITHWTYEEAEAVLIHELTHIRQNDYLWNIILICTENIFFFHPLVWIWANRIRMDREFYCDALAIEYSGISPITYAKTLQKLGQTALNNKSTLSLSLVGSKDELYQRVHRILLGTPQKNSSVVKVSIWLLFSGLLLLFAPIFIKMQSSPLPLKNAQLWLHSYLSTRYTIDRKEVLPFELNEPTYNAENDEFLANEDLNILSKKERIEKEIVLSEKEKTLLSKQLPKTHKSKEIIRKKKFFIFKANEGDKNVSSVEPPFTDVIESELASIDVQKAIEELENAKELQWKVIAKIEKDLKSLNEIEVEKIHIEIQRNMDNLSKEIHIEKRSTESKHTEIQTFEWSGADGGTTFKIQVIPSN